jgi:hypothetical protein
MARFRQAASEEGGRILTEASRRRELGVRSGLLSHRGHEDLEWDLRWVDYARCILLRDEAESLILGRVVSPGATMTATD